MTFSIRVFCPTCNNIFPFPLPERPADDFDIEKVKCIHCDKVGMKQIFDQP